MSDWQPIETAPKDGTAILVCIPGYRPQVAWWFTLPDHLAPIIERRSGWETNEPEIFETDEQYAEYWSGSLYEPTRWMPLPEPPK